MKLRPYQLEAINAAISCPQNPVIEIATGGGKSIVAAKIAEYYYHKTGRSILMLCPKKELIQQNSEELLNIFKGRVGIYCAGLGVKDIDTITVASINSVYKNIEQFRDIRTIIIDECHLVNSTSGMYKKLIDEIPEAKIIGLTATPYRSNSGSIIDGKIFHKLAYKAGIRELTPEFLSPLTSKVTAHQADTSSLKVSSGYGDFLDSESANLMMEDEFVDKTSPDIITKTRDRKKILLYCVTVDHARKVANKLTELGMPTKVAHGSMKAEERSMLLDDFKSGRVRAVANCSLYTTGLNVPDIDCIVMLRPTVSPVLMVQIAGRGTRKAEGKTNCLFLDYANTLCHFGPIDRISEENCNTAIQKVSLRKNKICETCEEINTPYAKECSQCGTTFIVEPRFRLFSVTSSSTSQASEYDELDLAEYEKVSSLSFQFHVSGSGNKCLKTIFKTNMGTRKVYSLIEDGTIYHKKSFQNLWSMLRGETLPRTVAEALSMSKTELLCPSYIKIQIDKNNFIKIIGALYES